ncbi:hypothetical protein RHMOL_Rhmol06G0217900 [Rhododendron molle]|uniref:Uncharacterized protein n=1 Tax=Rhododendron molle TaxID=49168 RepID=A0ACC0NGH4_RHOML|nr:hypothetical protein RHMOL_Rhmol06G0217900 [Rhododendron molle]
METASEENKSSTVGAEINKMKEERISRDRFSDLPAELLHRIFSLLPFKSIVQTVLLSKHWNHLSLWRSHPHLDFSRLSRNYMAMDVIPTVLSRRQPDFNITTFRLSGNVSAPCLQDCIDRVTKQRIEQLELDVNTGCCFDLPPSVFYCNTLRVLELNIGVKSNMPGYGFPNRVPGPVLFSSRNLPLLRKLCLKDCRGMYDLTINIPGLEILKLDGLRLKGLDISGTGLLELQVTRCLRQKSCAKILAPNLRRLYWEDTFNVKCATESFEDLNTGSVCFPSNPPNKATLQSAAAFISALCFARSLSVRSHVLKTLSKIDSEGGLPCSFNNLMTLELHTKNPEDEIAGIICLIRSSPILRTITITAKSCYGTRNEEWREKQYWISEIQKLKSIEFHLKVAR